MTQNERIKVAVLFGMLFGRIIEAFQPGHAFLANGIADFFVFLAVALVFTLLGWLYLRW